MRDGDLTDQGTVRQQPSRAKCVIVTGADTQKKSLRQGRIMSRTSKSREHLRSSKRPDWTQTCLQQSSSNRGQDLSELKWGSRANELGERRKGCGCELRWGREGRVSCTQGPGNRDKSAEINFIYLLWNIFNSRSCLTTSEYKIRMYATYFHDAG